MESSFRRTAVINIAAIGAAVVVFAAVSWWFSSDIKAQADRIVDDRSLLQKRLTQVSALAELKSAVPQAIVYQRAMDAILPVQERLLDFPRMLDNMARVRKVTLNFSFQGGQTKPTGDSPGHIGFTIDASGARGDVLNFIKDVELQAPRFLVSLDSADFTMADATTYRVSTQGRVFFR